MFKQSPSRNHRSKGIKIKHILQICVLVAVCFWLLYQVKHSHEKRKEFESKDDNSVLKLQSDNELQRFGRKDIPRVTETTTNVEKQEQDEDDKEDEEDRENKHEEDDTESEDARVVERGEERGVGDDEIDEHEPEKTEEDEEVDEDEERKSVTEETHTENEDTHEEEHPEEEEQEESGKEGDDVDKEDHGEREITSDDHDVKRSTREAQEQLYRADDASSEVAQNVQSISQESRNVTVIQENDIYRSINFGREHETKTSENADELMKPDIQQPREDVNSTASNATITEHKNDMVNLTKADYSSLQNSTLPEIPNNSTVVETLAVSSLSNSTQTTIDSTLSQNATVGIKQATDDNNQKDTGEDANKTENINTNSKMLASSNATIDDEPTKAGKDSLLGDGIQDEKPEETGKSGIDENSESQSSKDRGIIQHDPIDASDLDTMPEIRSEVNVTDDDVAG